TFAGLESIDQVTATTVRLNWTHDANAANYFVFSMNGGVPTLVDTLPAPTATYTVTGLTPATGYSFRVRAQDLLGNIGTNTNDVAVTTDSPPVLTDLDDLNFPSDYKEAGELVALDVNNVNNGGPGNDTFMSYACVFDTNADGAVNAGTDCANLP